MKDGVEPLIDENIFICNSCVGSCVGGKGGVEFCRSLEDEVKLVRCRDEATLNEEFTPYATRARWRTDSFVESMPVGTDCGGEMTSLGLEDKVLGETARDASGFNPFALAPMLERSNETKEKVISTSHESSNAITNHFPTPSLVVAPVPSAPHSLSLVSLVQDRTSVVLLVARRHLHATFGFLPRARPPVSPIPRIVVFCGLENTGRRYGFVELELPSARRQTCRTGGPVCGD